MYVYKLFPYLITIYFAQFVNVPMQALTFQLQGNTKFYFFPPQPFLWQQV